MADPSKVFLASGAGLRDLHPSLLHNANFVQPQQQQFVQQQQAPRQAGRSNGEAALAWDVVRNISEAPSGNVASQVALLRASLETTRNAYNAAVRERDQLYEQLAQAEARLAEVQRVVQRYAVVETPVVASDGYTYERTVIERYLHDCWDSSTEAISQQTKEVLTDVLLPNQSLRKLVDLLRTVKPQDLPPKSERRLLSGGGDAGKPREVLHAAELEASWTAATGPSSSNSRQGKNDAGARPPSSGGAGQQGGPSGQPSRATTGDSRLHPCLRVYGFCNYRDECAFACYPYDACLNNIKGKCRFGTSCKELHVNPSDPKYRNPQAQQSVAQAVGQANRNATGQPGGGSGNPALDDKRGPAAPARK